MWDTGYTLKRSKFVRDRLYVELLDSYIDLLDHLDNTDLMIKEDIWGARILS